jgi:hypothetical protein
VIEEICESFAQLCALGQSGTARQRTEAEFKQAAAGGTLAERHMRRVEFAVQAYASRPRAIPPVVESALFDGRIVFNRRTDADGTFGEMVLQAVVRTMLDIAKVTYLLSKGAGASGDQAFGHWRGRTPFAAEIALAIRHTRKYHRGFLVRRKSAPLPARPARPSSGSASRTSPSRNASRSISRMNLD